MSAQERAVNAGTGSRFNLSLDAWAVVLAFAAALLIRAGVFKHIPW